MKDDNNQELWQGCGSIEGCAGGPLIGNVPDIRTTGQLRSDGRVLMTWQEFKHQVESQGVVDSDLIDYIDMYPENGVPVQFEDIKDGRQFWILASDD